MLVTRDKGPGLRCQTNLDHTNTETPAESREGGREGGRSVKILSVIMSGSRAIHIVPVCRKFANNGGDISPLCGAPVPVCHDFML